MATLYTSAKNIVDFYIEQLQADYENSATHFALQYSNLKLLRYRTSSTLNALTSYDIEVDDDE